MRLKEEGFCDIEENHTDQSRAFLKTCNAFYFRNIYKHKADPEGFSSSKQDYYYYAAQYLTKGDFHNEIEKEIWRVHSEGFGVREIEKVISKIFEKTKVHRILKRLQKGFFAFINSEHELKKEDVLTIRFKKIEDEPFIYSSWLNSLYANGIWRNMRTVGTKKQPFMDRKIIFKYQTVIAHLLAKSNVSVNIACLKDDADIIVGYSVHERMPRDTILHWVYVREDWQREGIARDLCPKNYTIITHLTTDAESILRARQIKPKLISLPLSYEILENQFKTTPVQNQQNNKGELPHDNTNTVQST